MVCNTPLSFLGGVDTSTGEILDPECGSRGLAVQGKVLCFPHGKGSTVGSYAIYQLKLNRKAPAAIVNKLAEPIVATGAIMSEIPMIDGVDTSLIENGDNVFVDADSGAIELDGVLERHVVTCILRHKGDVLLLQRSNEVGSYRGRWAGVSGYIEEGESDLAAARREASEEVGLRLTKPSARTTPQSFRSGDTVWVVHPFLFDVPSRRISIDWEHDEHRWVNPTELRKYNTVPGLEAVVKGLLDGLIR